MRFSSTGDAAVAVPVVKSLREAHPDLRITVLTRPSFKLFFREINDIGFLDADFKGRHRGLGGIIRLWRDIQAYGVTHVADLHDITRTRILRRFLRLSRQKVAVIEKGTIEKRELTRKFRKEKKQLRSTLERYRDTIIKTGFDIPAPVAVCRTARPIPHGIIDSAGEKRGTWIGVAPFAEHKGRIYPTNLTYELIGLLSARYERVFIFGEGPYEKEFAEYMSKLHKGVFPAVGVVRPDEELDLISNLDAMVSMDSPAIHKASLVGTPVVSIWGATHPFAGFYGFGQDPENAVQIELPCRPCSIHGNKPCMYRDYHCLSRITPQSVADRVAGCVSVDGELRLL